MGCGEERGRIASGCTRIGNDSPLTQINGGNRISVQIRVLGRDSDDLAQ